MVKFYLKQILFSILILLGSTSTFAQQVPNPSFEDWSGEKYDGKEQLKDWYASNVTQAGFNFNLAHKEAGHSGSYSMMVQDTEVGAMGITEVSPGYFSLGKSLQERARLIISVAHPSAQEALDEAAFNRYGSHHHYIKGYMGK